MSHMLKMLLGIYLDFAINDAVPGLKSVNALDEGFETRLWQGESA